MYSQSFEWSEYMEISICHQSGVLVCITRNMLVYCDLRSPNIIVLSGSFFIVDFDWAGKVGEAVCIVYKPERELEWKISHVYVCNLVIPSRE